MGLVSILPGVPNLLLLLLIDSCLIIGSMVCKRTHASNTGSSSSGKKKVVIIGEMSDLAFEMATNASASTNYALDDVTFADYDDAAAPPSHQNDDHETHYHHHRHSPSKYSLQEARGKNRIRSWVGKRTQAGGLAQPPGSVFVPVAAYSVTHSRVGSGPGGVRRMRPGESIDLVLPHPFSTNDN